MLFFRHLLIDIIVVLVVIVTVAFLYQTYREPVVRFFLGEPKAGIFIRNIPLSVSIADTPEERSTGLAGVASLPPQEGKLFIFKQEGRWGFWMKDMLIPLDIIWIDNSGSIVHIEENVRPDSYPAIYASPVPARFVLEVNAFFVATFNVSVGDQVTIPANWLPADLRR